MDASEVGRFGTLLFVKRNDPNSVVAPFPIDDETVTIGRDPGCSVRLYYPLVSAVHAKITFRENKAFLVVIGGNGVAVDGCLVFPSPTSPTTVPLPNNTVIEIQNKVFRFVYPPKEIRQILLDTPRVNASGQNRRSMRLSMIDTSEVFSTRPSHDPQVNLKILQSPMKPRASVSPQKRLMADDDDDDDHIILVEGDHPRVVEEEHDLVIMEDVEDEPIKPLATPIRIPVVPAAFMAQIPKTPPPRARPRSSLHRSVLIRSAQRAAVYQIPKAENQVPNSSIAHGMLVEDAGEKSESEDDEDEQLQKPPSGWRKSLDAVTHLIFRSGSTTPDEGSENKQAVPQDVQEDQDMDDDTNVEPDEVREEVVYDHQPQTPRASTPVPRNLGNFMTPQIKTGPRAWNPAPRHSIGGVGFTLTGEEGSRLGGARRVKIEQPWKVKDIVIPATPPLFRNHITPTANTPQTSPRKQTLSEGERKAIQERRKSTMALTKPEAFFGGQTPGLRTPVATRIAPSMPSTASSSSASSGSEGTDKEMETKMMLQMMTQNNERWKRRQSGRVESSGPKVPPSRLALPAMDVDDPPRVSTPSPKKPHPPLFKPSEDQRSLFTGQRESFKPATQSPERPAYESRGEMLHTAETYRRQRQAIVEDDDEDDDDDDDHDDHKSKAHEAEISGKSRSVLRGRPIQATPTEAASQAEDEATSDVRPIQRKARLIRASRRDMDTAEVVEVAPSGESETSVQPKSRTKRGTTGRTRAPSVEAPPEERQKRARAASVDPLTGPSTSMKRTRGASTDPQPSSMDARKPSASRAPSRQDKETLSEPPAKTLRKTPASRATKREDEADVMPHRRTIARVSDDELDSFVGNKKSSKRVASTKTVKSAVKSEAITSTPVDKENAPSRTKSSTRGSKIINPMVTSGVEEIETEPSAKRSTRSTRSRK